MDLWKNYGVTLHMEIKKIGEVEKMKFMTFNVEGKEKYGIVHEELLSVWDLELLSNDSKVHIPQSLFAGIESGENFMEQMKSLIEWGNCNGPEKYLIPFKSLSWLPPLPRLKKNIMCVGKNYRDHAIEMGSAADIPEHVMVFTKAPTAIIGHNSHVDAHQSVTAELDYEGELALIIGKTGKNISQTEALDYVFGYTIVNDITARDLQERHKQFFIGKSLDTSCPIGPWIVHHTAIENPNTLDITTKVNGEVRQDSNTKNFIFPVEEIISVLSQGMTLEPGDIIATGTPAGVGKGFKPPRFLKNGDEIEIHIEGIGKLNNVVK